MFRLVAWIAVALLAVGCAPAKVSAPPPGSQTTTSIPEALEQVATRPPPEPLAAAPAEPALPPGPVSVAILLPLSGTNAGLGQDLLDAATLALFDIGSDDILLLPKDTGEESPGAVRAAAEQALAEGARIILGPVFAGSVSAVAAVAEPAGVPVIGFSSDRRVARPGVWLLGHSPEQQIGRVVTYAAAHGIERIGLIAPDDAQGAAMAQVVRTAATERGVAMAEPAFIDPAAIDVSAALREASDAQTRPTQLALQMQSLAGRGDDQALLARERLAALDAAGARGYQALVIAEQGERLRMIAGLLPYFGLQPPTVRLLGTALWSDPAWLADPALRGAWFAAPAPERRATFFTRFRQTFGRPALPIAPIAYDAVALAAALALAPGGADFGPDRLTAASGFSGVDGIFRFLPDGGTERGLAVYEVADGEALLVEGAPQTFEALTQ